MNFQKITIAMYIVILGLNVYLILKNMNKPDTADLVSVNGHSEARTIHGIGPLREGF